MSRIAMVAALSQNRVIGSGGRIPWKLPSDQQNFRKITMGHPLIMGRKTHESIGRPLDGRRNIVLTKQIDYSATGCEIAHSVKEAMVLTHGAAKVFVVGGEAVYGAFLPLADCLHLTYVDAVVAGDTHFPTFDAAQWREVFKHAHSADDTHSHNYVYRLLERIRT